MLKTTTILKEELKDYKNPDMKIHRMVEEGEIFRVCPGWYETDRSVPPAQLAGVVHRPSYLSFEYALAYHGLIPEKVTAYTSATYGQKKRTSFVNVFGRYDYQSVPTEIYAIGLTMPDWTYGTLVADPEKALCDQLYKMPPAESKRKFPALLFESLRINEEDFRNLDLKRLKQYAALYRKKNLHYLEEML